MSCGFALGCVEIVLNISPLAQAGGGCSGGCRGSSGSVIRSGLIGAANVSLPRYMFFPSRGPPAGWIDWGKAKG